MAVSMMPSVRIYAAYCFLALSFFAGPANAQSAPVCTTATIGSEEFLGVSGSSDSNVIGVGADGRAFRFNGSSWSAMNSGSNQDLNDVEVVNATTAFAVGAGGTALQLVGGNWVDRSGFTGRNLFGVWAASANEAYAVGDRGEIWIYNGVSWSDQSGAAGTDNRDIEDVWGDANNVYAMSERGELYVYNRGSGSWAARDDLCRQGNNFVDIWGDGSGNLYMTHRDLIYRHDGSSCQVVATAGDRLNGIYGSPDGQIYAGGRNGSMLYFDGASWTGSTEASSEIHDVWVSPTGTAYHGGGNAEITTCSVARPNIVADWPLDDCTLGFNGSTVIDAGPNGLNGSTQGGVDVESNGHLCSAAGLNGSSAFVRVPDTAALDFSDAMSLAVWVRHNGGLSDWQAILAKGDNSYRLHLNGGCFIADTLPGNTRYGITFGLNGGCAGADLNSNVVPTPGVWYHVAATYDGSVMRIYINGNLVNSANYSAAITNSSYDLFIGENSQNRGRYWNGDIDELTLWDGAISAAEVLNHMNRTRPCVSCASAEFVINHDNNGIYCLDETVQVSVVDGIGGVPRLDYTAEVTLDTQTGSGSWSLVSGSGVLTDTTPDDGVATYQWALNDPNVSFALSYRSGTPTFDIDVYQTSDPGVRDTDAEGLLAFSASGFSVTSAPLSNPPPATIFPFATAQRAAVDFPVYLTAYGQTATDPVCGVIESYDGSKNLQVWYDYINPVSGSIAPTIDGMAAATSEAFAGTQPVMFNNGQAVVTGRYKDAGQLRLHFKDNNVADPNLSNGIRGASGAFVSRPYTFVLSRIQDVAGTPNPAPVDAGGAPFVAAGAPFTVTVSALDADGDVTPNYGQETTPDTVALSSNLVSPAGGSNPAINSGTGFGPFVAGTATGTDFSWPEVGIIGLTPSVGDGDYLGAGNVQGAVSEPVGRFIPHHFVATTNVPEFATACTAGGFSYIGESLVYATPPVITLTAAAADGTPTLNYSGAYFRLQNSSLANRSYAAASGNLNTGKLPGTAADPLITSIGGGQATLTFDVGGGLSFVKATPEAPFNADISLAIDIFDTDGVAAQTNAVTFPDIAFNAGSEMRYGRVRLHSAIGSELTNLQVPMVAEYFVDASSGFVANVDDSCTAAVTLSLGGFSGNLRANDTCAIENGGPGDSGIACAAAGAAGLRYREPPLGGDFNLNLMAPGAGHDGSTTITADVPEWLRFDWDAAAVGLENPSGTATFGIFRGEDRRIYTREIY